MVVRDGRVGGRGGTARMLHGLAQGRARPLAWRGRQGPQGPGPAALPSAVVALSSTGSPEGAKVVGRGDGACEGTALQATRHEAGGADVCRTALRPTAPGEGTPWRRETWGAWSQPGPRSA